MLTSLHTGQDFEADLDYLFAAAGRLWTAGAGIDWSAFHAQSKRRRISLPTYPFERRRFWITPAAAAIDSRRLLTPTALPESAPLEDSLPASTAPQPSAERGAQMIKRLQTLFSELSGIDAATLDTAMVFLELGLDSLFLTQASGAIQKRFGVTVSLRELLEECPTLEALATRVLSMTPADLAHEPIAPAPAKPPVAKAGSALAFPMIEAFYFGPNNRQLFANYHLPVGGNGRVLTVICPPLFSEYMRTQLALRKLAISLAERGQHVLRLDYRGTGDSFGDLGEVAVSDWVEDIALAMREGRELSGSSVVRILGVRAGALLACRSVGATNDVQRLVLWDPVPEGTGYLESLRRIQMAVLERNYYLSRAERREGMHEYAGYRLSERMTEEFRLLDASTYSSVPKSKLHIVSTTSETGFPVPGVPQDVARFACNWETDSEDVLIPRLVLERLIACLTTS
ncbi:MAG: phosphopantetheine-binding protein [Burkholderiales bacterium]